MRAAKLVWSNNGWIFPNGMATDGVIVNGPHRTYKYGLEEFLFNPALLQRKLGYLDCYRANNIPGIEDVILFTLTPLPRPRTMIMIGVLRGVRQLR